MNALAGRSPFACRYPSRHRANSGIFSIPESTGAGTGAQNRAEDSDLGPQRLEDRSFSTECGPRRPPFAQNPVCKRPRMLNIPKNARRTLPQAPAARRRIASASPVTAGGPRAYLPNLSAGRKDPAARSARRGPDMSEDDLGGKPWGLRWGGSSRDYSSPKLMPSALASRTRSLWGSTNLSLPATSSSGMWHILPSRRAIM